MKYIKLFEGLDNQYYVKIKPDLYYYGSNFNGRDINEITTSEMLVKFYIEQEVREYGIKSILISGIQGPEEMDVEVSYYENKDSEDPIEETLKIPIDWSKINVEKSVGGAITINSIEITLENDSSSGISVNASGLDLGKLIIKSINIETNEL